MIDDDIRDAQFNIPGNVKSGLYDEKEVVQVADGETTEFKFDRNYLENGGNDYDIYINGVNVTDDSSGPNYFWKLGWNIRGYAGVLTLTKIDGNVPVEGTEIKMVYHNEPVLDHTTPSIMRNVA